MTIAIAIKVHEGVVLATDSRVSFVDATTNGKPVVLHAFDHANKTVNLHRDLPVGMVFSGIGSIGDRSISTIAKEFRGLIGGDDAEWRVDPKNYSVERVVELFHEYFYHRGYVPAFETWQEKPALSFILAGYSSGERFPEVWELMYNDVTGCAPKRLYAPKDDGIRWIGEGEAVSRLIRGFGNQLPRVLLSQGLNLD